MTEQIKTSGLNLVDLKMGKVISFLFLFTVLTISFSCTSKPSKSAIDIQFTQDTLNVGYTYWWTLNAPFNNTCDNSHSLVFAGTISQLAAPTTDSGPLYTSQEGVIEIERMYKIKDIGEKIYAAQKFISTDCFFESGLKKGDTVLVFCFDYEDDYSIPGKECILKINGFEDPLIQSVRKYIDGDDNPTTIKKDIGLWAAHGQGRALEGSIECWEEVNASQANQ